MDSNPLLLFVLVAPVRGILKLRERISSNVRQ